MQENGGFFDCECFTTSCVKKFVTGPVREDFTTNIKLVVKNLPQGQYAWVITEDRFGTGDRCGGVTDNEYSFTYAEETETEPEPGQTIFHFDFNDPIAMMGGEEDAAIGGPFTTPGGL